MDSKRALVIIGSPKKGNSYSLGEYFSGLLKKRGITCELVQANNTNDEDLLTMVNEADIIIFSFPLYIDCLPGPFIAVLEKIAAGLKEAQTAKTMLAIVNCGFPESDQARVALGIMEQFAAEIGVNWAGGLSLGGGEAMGGRSVEAVGGMLRTATAGLQLAADCVAKEEPISSEAVALVGKRLFQNLIYRVLAGHGYRKMAKANGVNIMAKPYAWRSRK